MKSLDFKNIKGITIVALVLAIVILLILTSVGVYFLNNAGIIQKSETAIQRYNSKELQARIARVIAYAGPDNLEEVYTGLKGIPELEKVADLTKANNTIEYKLDGNRYYVDTDGNNNEGYISLLPQGEWDIYMDKGLSSTQVANYLNVKITGNEITLNSNEFIYPGWQGRDNCLLITDTVESKYLDDGGSGQIHPYFDSNIYYPLQLDDKVEYGIEYISGNIFNQDGTKANGKMLIDFACNTIPKMGTHDFSWVNDFQFSLNHSSGYRTSSQSVTIPNYYLKGIYFSRFNIVKFENYKIKLSFKVNGDEILY